MAHPRRMRGKCSTHTVVEDWSDMPDHRACNEDVVWEQDEKSDPYPHEDKKS